MITHTILINRHLYRIKNFQ